MGHDADKTCIAELKNYHAQLEYTMKYLAYYNTLGQQRIILSWMIYNKFQICFQNFYQEDYVFECSNRVSHKSMYLFTIKNIVFSTVLIIYIPPSQL